MTTKNVMYVLGIILVILGLLGFVNNPVLGYFQVDFLHNLIHLVSGILLLVYAGRGTSNARMIALVLGIVYALITILGFLGSGGKILGLVANNNADNWLHLVFAVIFLIYGLRKSGNMPAAM